MNALRTALLAGVLALAACSAPPGSSRASSSSTLPTEPAASSIEDTTPGPAPVTREVAKAAPASLPEENPVEPIDGWPNACDLVDPQEEVPSASPGRYTVRLAEDTGDTCTWEYLHGTHRIFPLRVSLHPGVGPDDASLDLEGEYGSPYEYISTEVNGRKAVRIETTPDAAICGIALPTQDGHVFVRMQTWNLEESCTMAMTAAERIEERLPE